MVKFVLPSLMVNPGENVAKALIAKRFLEITRVEGYHEATSTRTSGTAAEEGVAADGELDVRWGARRRGG
jgi:hypothetical protein